MYKLVSQQYSEAINDYYINREQKIIYSDNVGHFLQVRQFSFAKSGEYTKSKNE